MGTLLNITSTFIDKKVAEGMFRELLQEKPAYRVLSLYGKKGMGKSSFIEHMRDKYIDKNYIYIELDFANRLRHKPQNAIISLAKELEDKHDFLFLSLWKAYAILWQKRYSHSPIMSALDLPYFSEIKKLIKIDNKGNFFIDIIKGLFKDNTYKELQKLKKLDTGVIENTLYRFFAEDLRNLLKHGEFKDAIIVVKNHHLLNENEELTPCQRDSWLREFILNVGKDALFIIESKESLNWQNCNVAWRGQIKSYEFMPFTHKEAVRYLLENGIKSEPLREAIIVSSGKVPFWLSLSVYAYKDKIDVKYPVTKEDIFNDFLEGLDSNLIKLLKVLSQARVFSIGLIKAIIAKYNLEISSAKTLEFLNSHFIKNISSSRYSLDDSLKDEFTKMLNEDELKDYKIFIFSYYENMLHSIKEDDIKNSPEIINNAIEEAWYYLTTINNEPLVHFEWLNYYIDKFFIYAAWEPFIDRYLKIIPKLQRAKDNTSKSKLITLFNNIAGLYESIGEFKKSKIYYNKVVKLNRPEPLLA